MKTYPDSVIDFANEAYDTISETLVESFPTYDKKWMKEISLEFICSKIGLPKFLKGEDLLFKDQEEAYNFLNHIYVELAIRSLIKKGLVDSIENEEGEEMIFLTQKGKELNIDLSHL
jgi:hypothetical protein